LKKKKKKKGERKKKKKKKRRIEKVEKKKQELKGYTLKRIGRSRWEGRRLTEEGMNGV